MVEHGTRAAEVVAWADHYVERAGAPEVRDRPWSTVVRLPTREGPVWAKATVPKGRHEVALHRVLATHVPERVLVPLAVDEGRGYLLLPDGGPSAFDGPPAATATRVTTALGDYADLQRAVASHRTELLATGTPDASPAALLDRYDEAVALIAAPAASENVDLHPLDGSDGASPARRARVARWARELADAPAADLVTVDHQDLHPGNIVAGPRFYDWGDAVVAHPFASLLIGLGALARALGVTPDDHRVRTARDTYLARFDDLAPHADLVATADLACRAAVVARALTWHRAIGGLGPDHPFASAPRHALAAVGSGSPFDVP